jgi:hypothetical protein
MLKSRSKEKILMSNLNPNQLHVRIGGKAASWRLDEPRRYTLTHSDLTGELFLNIDEDYDRKAISGLYTRLMRDEVLAEWITGQRGAELHVYCHVSGGLVFGLPGWRYDILQFHMPLVLQAFRCGDRELFNDIPELDQAPVFVHFRASQARYHSVEAWGRIGDYRLDEFSSSGLVNQVGRAKRN